MSLALEHASEALVVAVTPQLRLNVARFLEQVAHQLDPAVAAVDLDAAARASGALVGTAVGGAVCLVGERVGQLPVRGNAHADCRGTR